MNWERKLAVVGAIPLILIPLLALTWLTSVLDIKYGWVTPGWAAMMLAQPLVSPVGKFDLWPVGLLDLVNLFAWAITMAVMYALKRKRPPLLGWTSLGLALVLALESSGLAIRHYPFTPGGALAHLLDMNSPAVVSKALGPAVVIDTACWFAVFLALYRFVPRVRRVVK